MEKIIQKKNEILFAEFSEKDNNLKQYWALLNLAYLLLCKYLQYMWHDESFTYCAIINLVYL